MAKLTIVKDLCKGCGLCADVCPQRGAACAEQAYQRPGLSSHCH